MNVETIFADFLTHCRPGGAPERWCRSKKNLDVWLPPADVHGALASLAKEHPRKQLIRSGIAAADPDVGLSLGPAFDEVNSSFIALRRNPDDAPFDLLTNGGSVTKRLPLYAACQDYRIARVVNQEGFIFLTFSMQDLQALRGIGLPVAPAVGLEQFSPRTSLQFRGLFTPAAASLPAKPKRLVFVGWSPSVWSLHRPPGLDQVIQNLAATADGLSGPLPDEMFLWRPNAKQIHEIGACLATMNKTAVIRAIIRNLDESAVPLAPDRSKRKASLGLIESSTQLSREMSRSDATPSSLRRKVRAYQLAKDEELVKPLLEMAIEEPDLLEKSLLVGLAELHQVISATAASRVAQIQQQARRGLCGDPKIFDLGDFIKAHQVMYNFARRK